MGNVMTGVLVSLIFGTASSSPNAANPAAIAELREGARGEANAAWWGFEPEDATAALQQAIDSGAKRVRVPYMGAPWLVRPIKLRSDLELLFEPGVLVLAKAGAFKGKNDCLFLAVDAKHIMMRGYGATLRMRKEDYQGPNYEKAEWRTAIDFMGCSHVTVEGLRLENSGGDGIYLGATAAQPYCEDVTIRDVVCDGHHRQGISVIGARGLLIENCVLSNTDGTAPEAGIDLEPNHANEPLTDCVVRRCVMENNSGAGILVYLKHHSQESEAVSILFEDCLIRSGGDAGVAVGAVGQDGPDGLIEFRNCVVESTAKAGAYIYDKSPERTLVRFVNCHWRDTWRKTPPSHKGPRVPILIGLRRKAITPDFGGVEFVDCHVYADRAGPALAAECDDGEAGVRELHGRLFVHNPHGATMDLGAGAEAISLRAIEETAEP